MNAATRFSRPALTADRLGELAADRHRFTEKRVLITGESVVLSTRNGRACLFFAIRLLIRICSHVDVALPDESVRLSEQSRNLLRVMELGGTTRGLRDVDLRSYDAILSVGFTAKPDLPWTVINSQGWLARVSSGSRSLPAECAQENPIGALAAACLGAAEVFKRLIALRPNRGQLLNGLTFSLATYRCDGESPGPPLPENIVLPALLIGGCGAIGNGLVALLAEMRPQGSIWLADPQPFGEENLGTCLLMRGHDIGTAKAEVLAGVLQNVGVQAVPLVCRIEDIGTRLGHDVNHPAVVFGGFDEVAPRRQAQQLWPDVYIDGATSDLACQVSFHPWGPDVGCALCIFREPPGQAAETIQSRATGLSRNRLHEVEDVVTEANVAAAPDKKRAWLQARIGRKICSVIAEGVAADLSLEPQRPDFAPSVPFVACLAAAFVMAELVKWVAGTGTPLAPRFQMDVLYGPAFGEFFEEGRHVDCLCTTRRHNIERVRARRQSRTGS